VTNIIQLQYKFGEKIQALLELAGAKYLNIEEFCADSEVSARICHEHVPSFF
jgi:selenophosphate synthase